MTPEKENARRQPGAEQSELRANHSTDPLLGWHNLAADARTRQRKKKLPAFARPLADLRRAGKRPESATVVVRLGAWLPAWHVGEGWREQEGRSPRVRWPQVVVPRGDDPATLNFEFVRGLDVFVLHYRSRTDRERLRALLRQILACDPRRLIVFDTERSNRAHFVKSGSRGVEVQL